MSGQVHGDYGHTVKANVKHNYSSAKPSQNKIALFGNSGDSHQLQKILERNGGNVPIGGGAFIH